jgi:2-amino-4-hydroxy-6-hydroxymethyldihydropteridine diphosphokinase
MTRAVLSLGANIGDAREYLAAAVRSLGKQLRAASSVYVTPPWGPVVQDDFLNQIVIVVDDAVDARGWLDVCRQLEREALRERTIRWGPRTLDADVVAVWDGDRPVLDDDPELTLPHPRAAERAFVLVPWAELEPDAELPGAGRIADLLSRLDVSDIRRLAAAS